MVITKKFNFTHLNVDNAQQNIERTSSRTPLICLKTSLKANSFVHICLITLKIFEVVWTLLFFCLFYRKRKRIILKSRWVLVKEYNCEEYITTIHIIILFSIFVRFQLFHSWPTSHDLEQIFKLLKLMLKSVSSIFYFFLFSLDLVICFSWITMTLVFVPWAWRI